MIVLERVPERLRGELTRWMLELRAGVFVGTLSALVRDKLWEHACQQMRGGAGLLVHHDNSEQGFSIQVWGETKRRVVDFDGLTLLSRQAE